MLGRFRRLELYVVVTYGSVCSGIEAASVAWEPLGMRPAWFAEIEKFPAAVLAARWPDVANLGDMCALAEWVRAGYIEAPDVLVGGTPCQAFSVAGLRRGMADERGALTIKYVELADAIDEKRPGSECVTVWENVPGVLSDKNNAFGCFLGALCGETSEIRPPGGRWSNAGCVYGPARAIAWRVLDAQYFGVAQRRRRVFVVASARNGFDPAAVLFESEGMRRDIAPSRSEGAETTGHAISGFDTVGTLDARTDGGGFPGSDGACGGHVIAQPSPPSLAKGNDSHDDSKQAYIVECVTGDRTHALTGTEDGAGRGTPICFDSRQDPNVYGDMAGPIGASLPVGAAVAVYAQNNDSATRADVGATLTRRGPSGVKGGPGAENIVVAFAQNSRDEVRLEGGDGSLSTEGGKPGQGAPMVATASIVRRLTPVECERLQGFPDNHTRIPWRGKSAEDCPDGPRYKAIGNSKAVPVVRWLGRRILEALQ